MGLPLCVEGCCLLHGAAGNSRQVPVEAEAATSLLCAGPILGAERRQPEQVIPRVRERAPHVRAGRQKEQQDCKCAPVSGRLPGWGHRGPLHGERARLRVHLAGLGQAGLPGVSAQSQHPLQVSAALLQLLQGQCVDSCLRFVHFSEGHNTTNWCDRYIYLTVRHLVSIFYRAASNSDAARGTLDNQSVALTPIGTEVLRLL